MAKSIEQEAQAQFMKLLRGERPSQADLACAPVLDMWSVHVQMVLSADGRPKMCIKGEVTGHPKLSDGEKIETSAVMWLDRSMEWCRTRTRLYRLDGKVIDDEGLLT